MKRLLTILAIIIISINGFSQSIVGRANSSYTVMDSRFMAQYNLFVPRYVDTTAANLQKGIDTLGAVIFTYNDMKLWVRSGSPKTWVQVGSGSGGGTWGSITGTLSNQTDLQNALNLKAPLASPTFTGTVTIPTPFTLGAVSVLPTGTELNFVDGVTSNIQTQLDAKAPTASPTFAGTITTPLTASRAVVTGASSELAVSATTAIEIGYVSGVTSSIQTQIDAKATGSITQNWFDDDLTLNGVTTKINRADFFDDMLTTPTSTSGTSYMLEVPSGTGADASIGNTGTTPPDGAGWAAMQTGTTTTGSASLASTSVSLGKNIIDTAKTYRFEIKLQVQNLSDDTEDFRIVGGLVNNATNTTATNQIWFRYNDNTNAGNWTCYSSDGATTQNSDSGVAAAAGTSVTLGFEFDNAQVLFYINGSLVATHNTNIPLHNGGGFFPVVTIVKTLGTTSRTVFIDYVKYRRL